MHDELQVLGIRALLKALVAVTEEEYQERTQWVNPFADMARKIGDRALAANLSMCRTRSDAILVVKKRLYELDAIGFDPEKGPGPGLAGDFHTDRDLVEEVVRRDPDILSRRDRWTRRELIAEIQKLDGDSPCVGNSSNCGARRRNCSWGKDCAEMAELPEVADQVVEVEKFEPAASKRIGGPGAAWGVSERRSKSGREQERGSFQQKAEQNFIEFSRLENLLNFVEAALSGRVTREVREKIRVRHVSGPNEIWALIWPGPIPPAAAELLPVFEGQIVRSEPTGETLDLNLCLERIPLKPRSQKPTDISRLFVLVESQDPDQLGEMAKEIYRSFPRGLQVECKFFPASALEADKDEPWNRGRYMLILFSDFGDSRAVGEWVGRLPEYATAFYPLSRAHDNKFFCQWGFVYPVRSVARLYDLRDASYVLLRVSRPGEKGWVIVRQAEAANALRTSRQVFSVDYERTLGPPLVIGADETFEPYQIPLRAKEAPQAGLAELRTIGRKIDHCRQSLTALEQKYETIQQRVGGQCRAALVFFEHLREEDQPAEDLHSGARPFPLRLRQFLGRPTTSLSNFRYFFTPSPRPGVPARHVLISEKPLELLEILLSCADEIYLQDPRWQGWGVNIFCEQSLDLEPRLDDPQMAQKMLEHLRPADGTEPIECWLVTTARGRASRARGGDSRLLVLGVPRSKLHPLPEAFRLMNVQGAILPQDVVEGCSKELVESVDAECAQHVATLGPIYESIVGELEPQLRRALQDWRKIYERITNLREQTRQSENAVKEMEDLLGRLAPTWEKFVSSIMDLHLGLCRKREGLWEKFSTAVEEFAARKGQVEATFNRAVERISQVREEIRAAIADLTSRSKELEQQRAEIQQIHNQFLRQWQALQGELQELEEVLDRHMGSAEQIFLGLDRYLRQQEEVAERFDGIRKTLADLAKEKRELAAELSKLQSRAQELQDKEQRHRAEIAKLRATIGELKRKVVREDSAARQAQLEVEGLKEQVQNLNEYLKRLRAAAKRVVPEAETFVAVVRALVKSLQTRPSWYQAVRAGWLFARALVLVPYGFYPSEFAKSASVKVGRGKGGGKDKQRDDGGDFLPPGMGPKPVKPLLPGGPLLVKVAKDDGGQSSDFPARMEEEHDMESRDDRKSATGSDADQELIL